MKQLLCRRRTGVFRPRLSLERTGYSGDGWQWVIWFLGGHGRLVNAGGPLVADASPSAALREYFDFLRRIGCLEWDGVERDRRRKKSSRGPISETAPDLSAAADVGKGSSAGDAADGHEPASCSSEAPR